MLGSDILPIVSRRGWLGFASSASPHLPWLWGRLWISCSQRQQHWGCLDQTSLSFQLEKSEFELRRNTFLHPYKVSCLWLFGEVGDGSEESDWQSWTKPHSWARPPVCFQLSVPRHLFSKLFTTIEAQFHFSKSHAGFKWPKGWYFPFQMCLKPSESFVLWHRLTY